MEVNDFHKPAGGSQNNFATAVDFALPQRLDCDERSGMQGAAATGYCPGKAGQSYTPQKLQNRLTSFPSRDLGPAKSFLRNL